MVIAKIRTGGFVNWVANLFTPGNKKARWASTFGKTIYVRNAKPIDLVNSSQWMRHEVQHLLQFKEKGFVKMCYLYLISYIKVGYEKNVFEIEAELHKRDNFPIDVVLYSNDIDNFIVLNRITFEKLFYISVVAKDSISKAEIERILKIKFNSKPLIHIQV